MHGTLPPALMRLFALIAINVASVVILTSLCLYVMRSHMHQAVGGDGVREKGDARAQLSTTGVRPGAILPPAPAAMGQSRERMKQLESENRALSSQLDQIGNWVLSNVKGTYPLPADMVRHLSLTAVETNYTVHAELARLLRMNETEQAMINDALAFARSKMEKTETPLVNVMARQDNRVSLYVPPYEQDGQRVREDLMGAMEGSLGGARFDQLVNVSGKSLDEAFHYFGTAARTVEVELVPPQGTETAYLLIRDGWQIPDGESVTHWTGRETATRELPAEYASFRAWLPPAIAVYAR